MASIALTYLAIAFLIVNCGGFCYLFMLQRKRLSRLENALSTVQNHLEITSDSGIGVGRKVVSLEQRLRAAEQKQHEIESTDLQKVSYNEAVRLISMGANVDDLVSSCGLTRAEANLLDVLHVSQVKEKIK